jgi:uncharacterized DUF497 family protein
VNYEWDDEKAISNLRKHRVDFVDAIGALEDRNRLEQIDAELDYGEERLQIIGMAHNSILFVVATMRSEDLCRIISARKADRDEQDRYYAGDPEAW